MSVGRNAPCPCGSGRRFKECHGLLDASGAGALDTPPASTAPAGPAALPPALVAALVRAAALVDAGAFDDARRACEEALALAPDQIEALRLLARAHLEMGRAAEAVAVLLRAARAVERAPAGGDATYRVLSELAYALVIRLGQVDTTKAALLRMAYARWQDQGDATAGGAPLVTVLIVDAGGEAAVESIESVIHQTYPRLEIVLASDRDLSPGSRAALERAEAQRCIAWRHARSAGGGLQPLLLAGAQASRGEFLQLAESGHRLTGTRVQTLVQALAPGQRAWGFARTVSLESTGAPGTTLAHAGAQHIADAQARIAELPSVGHAFLEPAFVAASLGNFFVRRDLALDALREALPAPEDWSFALALLEREEPVFVAGREHRLVVADEKPAALHAAELAQVALFRAFYARALDPEFAPRNRFAPCLRYWGAQFAATPLRNGHVLALPIARLEALEEDIARREGDAFAAPFEPGVTLVGFPFGEFGLAESLRGLARACAHGAVPFAVKTLGRLSQAREQDASLAAHATDRMNRRCALHCFNPDVYAEVRALLQQARAAGVYNIGYWYWELDTLPLPWRAAFDAFDEVWTATEFVASAVREATSKPVTTIAPPVGVRLSRPYSRAEFELPADRFLFLASFDFHSFMERKNPAAAVAAFKRAFPRSRRDVGLVLKSINGARRPEKLEALQSLVDGDDRIVVADGYVTRDAMWGLESVVDAYVSLHRAEGLGLGPAESMALGKPVVATAYSGNMAFMTPDNSALVGFRLVPVARGEYLYDDERFRWAEPDLDEAADWMRRLADEPALRAALGSRAARDIAARFTTAATARSIRARFATLGMI